MNELQAKVLSSLSALIDKIALELVFAQPASDGGLLPINSFINDMEEAAQTAQLPAPAVDAIVKARALIDQTFETGQFTAETLAELQAWVPATQFQLASLLGAQTSGTRGESASADPSAESIELDLINDREVLSEFVNESREHLQNIESGALRLEENPGSADILNSIFRAFHTFKGSSGFLGLKPMNRLAHDLESLLDLARQQRLPITLEVVEIILQGGDTLKRFIEAIAHQLANPAARAPITISTAALHERIAQALATPAPIVDPGTNFFQRAASAEEENPQTAVRNPQSSATVKVETAKLDALIDMVGEMIIAQSLVAQDPEIRSLASSRITRSLTQLARTTKDLQRTAMSLRMVPVRGAFRKMSRVVRDLSLRSGKQIELVLRGEETELDRNIVEEIHDPLLHMIRNSVDHGIETPEARTAAEKSAIGQITLAAFHQGGNIVIQIKDDGAGLNRDKILKKATALGLVQKAASELPDKEIFNYIFAPGFSTAETITDISGRGVGMDVVRRNIEQLRGKIEIQSTPGQGATFSIFLPLTLAIIDGLIVRVGEHRYILPALSVRESFRPTAEMLSTVHGKGEIVDVRGRLLPILRLNEILGIRCDEANPCEAVLTVIESDGAERCLLVDELLGKQEVVIKSLGDTFQTNPLLAGAAILGDGRVGLILDVHALVHPKQTPLSKAA